MKKCYCGKICPDDEKGSICTEYNADGSIYKKYWICDHCVFVFDNDCNCSVCQRYKELNIPIGSEIDWNKDCVLSAIS